jgi:trehalose 6-phosphate phosphatase
VKTQLFNNNDTQRQSVAHWQDTTDTLQNLFNYERVGLITDMDGTVSPIVPVPDDAQPTERNRQLLRQLHEHLALVAVVSGRAVADVRARIGLPQLVYIGNHGLERWQDNQVVASPQAAAFRPKLNAAIAHIKPRMPEGMWIEDKQVTLSLHYRDAENPQEVAKNYKPMLFEIAEEHGLRLFEGRMIFEMRPPLNINKGTIFEQLVAEYDLQAALYLGDDTTDADALKMAQVLRQSDTCYSFAIGVTSDETPLAVLESSDFLVNGVDDVEVFLGWLLSAAIASVS